jgi:hypothetical protein
MTRVVLAVVAAAIATACSGSTPAGPGPVAGGSTNTTDAKPSGVPRNWVTHLAGRHEIPARDTNAQGQIKFQLNAEGTVLSYRLISSNIENIVQSHIHVGPVDDNGPISVFLFGPVAPNGGRHNGILAEGEITDETPILNSGQTGVATFAELIEAMDAGNTYVNVHTNNGAAPANEGPGDFPGGEIRGQIKTAGH